MKKLFYIYTNPRFLTALYNPVMAREFDQDPDVDVTFLLDQSILKDTLANDTVPTPSVQRRLGRLVENCREAGADCVVVGCTAMNLATLALAEGAGVPLISVDEPMIAHIAADGRKNAAIITHADDNGETIRRRLAQLGIASQVFVAQGAKAAMDDPAAFRLAMEACARSVGDEFDCIALGHISAEEVPFADVDLPVYRCGADCIRAIRKVLG